jgi:hypothetical protein
MDHSAYKWLTTLITSGTSRVNPLIIRIIGEYYTEDFIGEYLNMVI